MTLSQIQCFLVVAEKMSITEAANLLYVTQPAVSHRISKLEQELGVQLFNRDNSKIGLTPAGKKYKAFFNDFVEGLKKIAGEVRDEDQLAEEVVIGCSDGWDISDLFRRTRSALADQYPGISLKLDCCGNDELIGKINSRNVDVVFALESIFLGVSDMEITPVKMLKGILVYSDHHPLAKKDNLCLTDFKEYPFYVVVSQKNSFAGADIIQYCMQNGFSPKTEYVNSLSAALVKMRTESGVLISDELLLSSQNPLFKFIEIDLTRRICVGIRKDHSRACGIAKDVFVQAAQDVL